MPIAFAKNSPIIVVGDAGSGGGGGDSGDLVSTNNLSDLDDFSEARDNLGLGSIATQAANSVSITGGSVTGLSNTGLSVLDTDASHTLTLKPGSNLSAARVLTLTTGDASRTLTVAGDTSVSGTNTGDQTITLSGDVSGSGTGSISVTIGATRVTNAMLAGSIVATNLVGSDIATVGTVTSGTWSATAIALTKGGTGQTSANASFNALAPSQTGSSGKFLTSNATDTSWGVDGSSLTTLNASNISSGTLSNSRLSGVALTGSANAFTVGGQTITIVTTSDVGLSVIGASGQSGDLLRLRVNGPTTAVAFDSSGYGFPVPVTFGLIGVQTTGTSKTNNVTMPYAGKIVKAWINAKTGPTSADFIVDINLNSTSIWNSTQANRVKIVAAATTGNQTSFDTTAVAAGDVLSIDVDQIGSGTAGSDVAIVLTILTKNQ